MRANRKKTIRTALLMMVLLLGIGFAALAANLKIDGTLNVSRTSWDVHFENVNITTGSVTANPAPTSDNTTTTEMAYTINFTKPGDFYEFTVDMVNDGTIDAMVDVVSNNAYANASSTTPITLPTYLTSTVTYDDGVEILPNQELLHNTSEKIKVRVEFKKDIEISDLPSNEDTSIVFKFVGDYKQADENVIPVRYNWVLPTGKTKDNLENGDEICLRGQCFNFIRYDGTNNEDIVMLAKYNLKVGNIYDSSGTKTGEYTSSDPEYGLQSSEARGYVHGASIYKGTVAFSTTNYWDDNGSLKSDYPGSYDGTNYPTVYDPTNYGEEPGELDEYGVPTNPNYSIAYYVEQYKAKLENDYHATIKEARLLTYDEAMDESIGCENLTTGDVFLGYACPDDRFVTNTSFWFGTGIDNECVWAVNSGSLDYDFRPWQNGNHGVRPVIVISKSNI